MCLTQDRGGGETAQLAGSSSSWYESVVNQLLRLLIMAHWPADILVRYCGRDVITVITDLAPWKYCSGT